MTKGQHYSFHSSLYFRIPSQPPTPSPSLYPLLQLGENEKDDTKIKKIQLLESSIIKQEEEVK